MRAKLIVVGALSVLLVAGCSSSSSESEEAATGSPSASPTTSATEQSAAAGDDGGCSVATADGTTKNAEMQALATQVYSGLTCGGSQTLDDQLRAAAASPEVTSAATAAGLDVSVDSAAGGTVMQIVKVEDRSACNITVINDLDAKTLTCADL